MGASAVLACAMVPRTERRVRQNRHFPTVASEDRHVPRIGTCRSSATRDDDTRVSRSLGGVAASSSVQHTHTAIRRKQSPRDVSNHARQHNQTVCASLGVGDGDSQKTTNSKKSPDFMADFTAQFPTTMGELRLRVRTDVRRNTRAAKHLLGAQVCFVVAAVLVKHGLAHFTPAGFLVARALCSLPLLYGTALIDKTSAEVFDLRNPLGGGADTKSTPTRVSGSTDVKRRTGELSLPTLPKTTGEVSVSSLFNSGYVKSLGALVLLGQVFTVCGLRRVAIANAQVIGQLVPVYALLIACAMGVERPSCGKFTAIGLGVAGAAVALDPSNMWLSTGNVFLLLRTVAFAAFLAVQAPALHHHEHSALVTVISQLIAASVTILVCVPIVVVKTGLRGGALFGGGAELNGWVGNLRGAPLLAWGCVLGVAVLCTAAHLLTAHAEKNTTLVVTACYNSTQPVFALVLLCALGEAPGARNVAGSFLILVGVAAAVGLSTNDKRRWRRRYDGIQQESVGAEQIGDFAEITTDAIDEVAVGTETRSRSFDKKTSRQSDEFNESEGTAHAPGRGSTVRIKRETGRSLSTGEPVAVSQMVWTSVWAVVMSLCALAGGGLLTWSAVWVYWKLLL